MSTDDRQLVLGCREGQEEAYRLLLSRHEGYIYSLCYKLTGHREDALELSQEAMIKIVTGLESFQVNRPFKPWLRQVVINTGLNFLRRNTSKTLSLDQPGKGNLTLADTLITKNEDDPLAQVEWMESQRVLQMALGRLPPIFRLVLLLRHQEEMSYQEIAAATELPLGTVKTYLFRARNMMRQSLTNTYGWEADGRGL